MYILPSAATSTDWAVVNIAVVDIVVAEAVVDIVVDTTAGAVVDTNVVDAAAEADTIVDTIVDTLGNSVVLGAVALRGMPDQFAVLGQWPHW